MGKLYPIDPAVNTAPLNIPKDSRMFIAAEVCDGEIMASWHGGREGAIVIGSAGDPNRFLILEAHEIAPIIRILESTHEEIGTDRKAVP